MGCLACDVNKNIRYYSDVPKKLDYSLSSSLESFILSNAFPLNDDHTPVKQSISSLFAKDAHLNDILAEQDEAIAKVSLILQHYEDSHRQTVCEQSHVEDLLERHRQAR
ncbi:uncharacterized protein BT62DRAFT_923032 [Guyanagaster necrorhizus]|uniref:Uncharacterized protein n=1 Tax=Guyanagaster necrorhizus TaxID=856835 RepID=A0A9P8ANJ1_9AGAR|nr:uncharacterized protein BT62DRAFT_923032 [Guyanagaster necrorhizus MCA 3950]KAG7441801.1 hypothetical protein BT62DRAFT_923032 [Guyanagaster necrorhizus MCA 3950]